MSGSSSKQLDWRERYLRIASVTGILNTGVSALVVLFFLPLIILQVGMESYGTWATLTVFIGIASMVDLGISKALVFLLPRTDDDLAKQRVLGAASAVILVVVAVIAVAGVAIVAADANLWGENDSLTAQAGQIVNKCGLLVGALVVVTAFLRAVLEAHYKLHLVNLGYLALTVLQYVALLSVSVVWGGVVPMLMASVAVYAVVFVLNLAWVARTVPLRWLIPRFAGLIELMRVSWSFFGNGIAIAAIEPIALFVLVRMVRTQADFGEYDIALRIAHMANGMLVVLATPLFGMFSGMAREGIGEIVRITWRVVSRTGVLFLFGLAALWLVGRPALELWLGVPATVMYALALVLVAGLGLVGVSEPFTRALWALGLARRTLWLRVGQLGVVVLGISFLFFLPPVFRIAVTLSASFALYGLGSAIAFRVAATHHRATPAPQSPGEPV